MQAAEEGASRESFVWTLFQQLRRRQFGLGIEDYEALRTATRLGFGIRTRSALRDLCCALWAKSEREGQIVSALFAQLKLEDWNLDTLEEAAPPTAVDASAPVTPGAGELAPPPIEPVAAAEALQTAAPPTLHHFRGLPPISVHGLQWPDRSFVFVPQFPVGYRETAQVWRRLRRAVRYGPPTELDLPSTIRARVHRGVTAAPVLRPRRRNVARLLILVDRHGSMTPFHAFVDDVLQAIARAAALQRVDVLYFRNLPVTDVDRTPLDRLAGELRPTFDGVLSLVRPAGAADVAASPDLLEFQPLAPVLEELGPNGAVAVVSDAGAARRGYRPLRLLESLSFLRMLQAWTTRVAWMNPVPASHWPATTAGQIARHWPMFPMTRAGMHDAVNVPRGQPAHVERPL
jgi:hypothetical protein